MWVCIKSSSSWSPAAVLFINFSLIQTNVIIYCSAGFAFDTLLLLILQSDRALCASVWIQTLFKEKTVVKSGTAESVFLLQHHGTDN